MDNINIIDDIIKRGNELPSLEHSYGRCLTMPLVPTNSGSRRIMYSTQSEHALMNMNGEVSLFQTGYENQYGDHASSLVVADKSYKVISKIPKFSFIPDHHYYLLVQSEDGEYDIIERIAYKHITESYGYLYNNDTLDKKQIGDVIKPNSTIKKSLSYDECNNRKDGVNLLTTYLACEHTKEDGIIISESAREKLYSPLLKKVTIQINDNDIPLNLYGNNSIYKAFPDIGEKIQDRLLCALRREKKEEMLFSQSYDRLSQLMISDEKFPVHGEIIDINIYCNNPEILSKSHYFSQLEFYYNEQRKFLANFLEAVSPIMEHNAKCSYELQKMYHNNVKMFNNTQFIKDRRFSNTTLEIVVLDKSRVEVGDKISNRYGGKGVISQIRPDHLMPQILDTGEYLEIIFNSSTCVNRENAGQLYETSINSASEIVRNYCKNKMLHTDETISLLLQYLSMVVPTQAQELGHCLSTMCEDDQNMLLDSLLNDAGGIIVSMKPASESISIDDLDRIYKAFPFIKQQVILVPQRDSNGGIRYIKARRPLVCGKQYMIRLKQYAEDKFSAVSLAATNIQNINSKNNSKKAYKAIHSKTCIKFGEMEMGNLIHLNPEIVITNLLLHSLSPKGRRLCEKLLTGDPFNIDVRLDEHSSNRSVEILNAYLLTMGLEFQFNKILKQNKQIFAKYQQPWDIKPIFHKLHENEIYDGHYFNNLSQVRADREIKPIFQKCIFKDLYQE